MTDLSSFLATLPQGPITDTSTLARLLADAWHDFAGSNYAGMEGRKLLDRNIEYVAWTPPLLTFTVERHGATVLGSTRAKLQEWTLDLEMRTASFVEKRHRQ